VLAQGFLDAPGGGGASDALVDRERLLEWSGGLGGVAVAEVAVADAFQGACLFRGGAEVAGDGQRLGVVAAGLVAGGGAGRELAEAVQRFGLAEPVAGVAAQREGLLVAGRGGRVVAGLLHQAELIERVGLVGVEAEVAAQREGLPAAGAAG
jgi:hypothetical protein